MSVDPISKVSILVADSNVYLRKLARSILLYLGVRQVYEAPDGVAALESIRSINPDILLINWSLIALDGHEVVRIIRNPDQFSHPDIPIILMTDDGSVARITEAMKIGAHEILLKPFSPAALEQRLRVIVTQPRPMVRFRDGYFPQPRAAGQSEQELARVLAGRGALRASH